MRYISCAFVNDIPVKEGRIVGYYVEKNHIDEYVLSVIREIFYSHPETSEAMLVVLEPRSILYVAIGHKHYAKLKMLYLMQEICQDIPHE